MGGSFFATQGARVLRMLSVARVPHPRMERAFAAPVISSNSNRVCVILHSRCHSSDSSSLLLAKCPGNGSVPMLAGKYESVSCSLGQEMGCPAPYTCAYASINATEGLCCMVPEESVICPGGMEIAIVGQGHQRCSPFHLSTCPEGGACVFNEAYGIYYCCKSIERGESQDSQVI